MEVQRKAAADQIAAMKAQAEVQELQQRFALDSQIAFTASQTKERELSIKERELAIRERELAIEEQRLELDATKFEMEHNRNLEEMHHKIEAEDQDRDFDHTLKAHEFAKATMDSEHQRSFESDKFDHERRVSGVEGTEALIEHSLEATKAAVDTFETALGEIMKTNSELESSLSELMKANSDLEKKLLGMKVVSVRKLTDVGGKLSGIEVHRADGSVNVTKLT
jgi:hypothetical protein